MSYFEQIGEPVASHRLADPTEKLKQLKRMLDEELITEADYEAKKAEILAKM